MPSIIQGIDLRLFDEFSGTEADAGIEPGSINWEVIVKYNDDILGVGEQLGATVEILNENYAILTLPRDNIKNLYSFTETEYVELPRYLSLTLFESTSRSCIPGVHSRETLNLRGEGSLIAIIDSGIDYMHPDFRNPDGSTRIECIWDQSILGAPPSGFSGGTEYSREQIDHAIKSADPYSIVPSYDYIGHGTAVAGIAAGNGAASRGQDKGVAPEATLIIVKLGHRQGHYARNTELMRAIKYVIDKALYLKMPIAINISYGTNNGSHDGSSLFTNYIDEMALKWKCSIVVAMGNEGSAGHHFSAKIKQGERAEAIFTVSENLPSIYLSFWNNFVDTFSLELILPNGISTGLISPYELVSIFRFNNVAILVAYGQPTHYSEYQEIYFQMTSLSGSISPGIWRLIVRGNNIVDGRFDIWLPTTEAVGTHTAFALPNAENSLTIPATSKNAISVGGYNSMLNSIAEFSGRGYTRNDVYIKPDIVAPAVNIISTSVGGGYDSFTGTSMAAPFVTGSAALMMQWGIVKNHDSFLYGQRIKAFLQKGAKRDQVLVYPNTQWGYGSLCLEDSMLLLIDYVQRGSLR